jgi:hypothetical protein
VQSKCIGIVCRDAGAANQIAHYVLNNPGEYRFALQDPALSIFVDILGNVANQNFEAVMTESDQILTGSGWTSNFEWEGMRAGRIKGKKVITHLDHWNNYRERFVRNSELILPNEIWVTDDYSETIAHESFPSTKIVRKSDYYLRHQIIEIEQLKSVKENSELESTKKILFLSEPLISTTNSEYFLENNEGEALKNEFMAAINRLGINLLATRIRLHPSEISKDKESNNFNISESDFRHNSLSADLAWADIVVGIDSYALYVSDCARIPTISIASWSGRSVTIPKGNIEFMSKNEFVEFLSAK